MKIKKIKKAIKKAIAEAEFNVATDIMSRMTSSRGTRYMQEVDYLNLFDKYIEGKI